MTNAASNTWRYAKITWLDKSEWHTHYVRHGTRLQALESAYRWAQSNVPTKSKHRASVRALREGEIPDAPVPEQEAE